MKKKTSSRAIICQNFKIPQQTIFQDYKCSLKSSLTYFGRLYIGQDHVCFIANMFGILKKCVIEIQKITKLQEPNKQSLLIQQNGEYLFNGFKNDNAYVLIKALWKKEKVQSNILNQKEDEESFQGVGTQVNKEKLIDQGNLQSSFFNLKASQADKQRLCEFQLPISVQQFYQFILADNATIYPRSKHLQLRDSKQIVLSSWRKSQQLESQIKQVSAMIRVNGVPFMSHAHMNQVWKLKKNQNNQLFIDIVTQMGDVPYSNYFVVNAGLNILKDTDTKCRMLVDMSIVFSKSTYMKNTILTKTMADMKEDFQFWFTQVKNILAKMKKTQDQSKLSKVGRIASSSDIEYETDVPQIQSSKHTKHNQKSLKANPTQSTMMASQKSIENLKKLVIVLIILMIIQLTLSGISIYQNGKTIQNLNNPQSIEQKSINYQPQIIQKQVQNNQV